MSSARKESKVAVRVRIPELSLELYNQTFLERLGGSLGTYLKMDRLTSIQSRGQFARLRVEIDLAKPLVSYVMCRGYKLKLEYEGLHSVCFKCGVYEHRMETCSLKHVVSPEMEAPPIHAGESKRKQGSIHEVASQGVGAVASEEAPMCRVQQVKQIDMTEGEGEKANDGQAENLEDGGNVDSFGPWMLVKRGRKKKGTHLRFLRSEKKRMEGVVGSFLSLHKEK